MHTQPSSCWQDGAGGCAMYCLQSHMPRSLETVGSTKTACL